MRQEKYAKVGGVLVFIMGMLEIVIGLVFLWLGSLANASGALPGAICMTVFLILGILAMLGGISAIQRKNYALAVIGGVCSIISAIGIVGLILIIVSKEDFE